MWTPKGDCTIPNMANKQECEDNGGTYRTRYGVIKHFGSRLVGDEYDMFAEVDVDSSKFVRLVNKATGRVLTAADFTVTGGVQTLATPSSSRGASVASDVATQESGVAYGDATTAGQRTPSTYRTPSVASVTGLPRPDGLAMTGGAVVPFAVGDPATTITLSAAYILANHDAVGTHTFVAQFDDGESDLITLATIAPTPEAGTCSIPNYVTEASCIAGGGVWTPTPGGGGSGSGSGSFPTGDGKGYCSVAGALNQADCVAKGGVYVDGDTARANGGYCSLTAYTTRADCVAHGGVWTSVASTGEATGVM